MFAGQTDIGARTWEGFVMNIKSLKKKIQRLIGKIEKDTRKLGKLRLKLTAPPKKNKNKKHGSKKAKATARSAAPAANPPKAVKKTRKQKKKRNISPERRAQMAAAMKARWAAKRAAVGSTSAPASMSTPSAAMG
jgi:peptidoglycan hydrolase CwlO-like protein